MERSFGFRLDPDMFKSSPRLQIKFDAEIGQGLAGSLAAMRLEQSKRRTLFHDDQDPGMADKVTPSCRIDEIEMQRRVRRTHAQGHASTHQRKRSCPKR